ncbi:hypothetical protein ABZX39_31290 [Streptomyces collinus]|uniref:hypothetical protein n=1 Tax=Streptomyces collinus TaxID=42684 RepID=UPI00339F3719
MTRVRDIPVRDSTRVRDVRVATGEAVGRAGRDAHRTAVAALVATEPATGPLKHAGGGRLESDSVDGRGTAGPWVQSVALDDGPARRGTVMVARVDRVVGRARTTAACRAGGIDVPTPAHVGSLVSVSTLHSDGLPGRRVPAADPGPLVRAPADDHPAGRP